MDLVILAFGSKDNAKNMLVAVVYYTLVTQLVS